MTSEMSLSSLVWVTISLSKTYTLQLPSVVKSNSSPQSIQFVSRINSNQSHSAFKYGDLAPSVSSVKFKKRDFLCLLTSKIQLEDDGDFLSFSFPKGKIPSEDFHVLLCSGKLRGSCLTHAVLVHSQKASITTSDVNTDRCTFRMYQIQNVDNTFSFLVKPKKTCHAFVVVSPSWLTARVNCLTSAITECSSIHQWRAQRIEEQCISLSHQLGKTDLLAIMAERQKSMLAQLWATCSTQYIELARRRLAQVLKNPSNPDEYAAFFQKCGWIVENVAELDDFLRKTHSEMLFQLEVIAVPEFTDEVKYLSQHLVQFLGNFKILCHHISLQKQFVSVLHSIARDHSLKGNSRLNAPSATDESALSFLQELHTNLKPVEAALAQLDEKIELQVSLFDRIKNTRAEEETHSKHGLLSFHMQILRAHSNFTRSQCLNALTLLNSIYSHRKNRSVSKLEAILSAIDSQREELTSRDLDSSSGGILQGFFCFDYLEVDLALQSASKFISHMRTEKQSLRKPSAGMDPHCEIDLNDSTSAVELEPVDVKHSDAAPERQPISPQTLGDDWSFLDDGSISSEHNEHTVQISTLKDVATLSYSLPLYSSIITNPQKILPFFAQTIHNLVEYTHFLMYNLSGCTPYIYPVWHQSGHFLLWTTREFRENHPKKLITDSWKNMKRALISAYEVNAVEDAMDELLWSQVCCSTNNPPLIHILSCQLIPLLLSILNYGFDVNNGSGASWLFGVPDSEKDIPVCALWENVGKSCKWMKDLLEVTCYSALMQRETFTLHESNQISEVILQHAMNEHCLSNCIVEFARNRLNMTYYSDDSLLKSREQLQALADLMEIVDTFPLYVDISPVNCALENDSGP
mmetsp:Transcript_4621/g.17440  ORF Transcript_4621/g.17440 Transcript_4621/m.17440 type:complete len:861 (-) Transcript_4621:28-2610(-)